VGNRLSKIYTKTGDDCTTGLGDGSRTPKSSLRIKALGAIDEANAQLGLLIDLIPSQSDPLKTELIHLSHRLFDLGGEISIPDYRILTYSDVIEIEQLIDKLNEPLPPLKNFIMPSGAQCISQAHVLRAVTRRAEISIVELKEDGANISDDSYQFINRLSDLWFVVARHLAAELAVEERLWEPVRSKK